MVDFTGVKSITIPEGNVVKITSDDTVLWEKITSRLPSEYQEVEYIYIPNTAYINTGWIPQLDCTFHIKLSAVATGYLFGSSSNPRLAAEQSSKTTLKVYNPSNGTSGIRSYDGTVGEVYDIEAYVAATYELDCYAICNGTEMPPQSTVNNGKMGASFSQPMLLGAWQYNATTLRQGAINFYYAKANESGVPKFEMIPCYRKSDGVIGAYDLVSKTFFTNAGTGNFTKGADV